LPVARDAHRDCQVGVFAIRSLRPMSAAETAWRRATRPGPVRAGRQRQAAHSRTGRLVQCH